MFSMIGQGLILFSEVTNAFLGEEKLQFKRLTSETDFEVLQNKFEELDGIRLPTDYLKQGRAFVCFNESLEAQGGFALIDNGPFRCLEQLPDEVSKPEQSAMTEITAVFLTRGRALRRTRYWSFVIGNTLLSQSSRIVYAVDSEKTALRERVFNHIRAHTLYEGPVKKLEGMSNESVEAVELTTKVHLAKGFLKLALKEAEKLKPRLAIRSARIPTEPVAE
jgi:hypothetical protein